MTTFKALTIHQPWAWALAAGHKDIENRTWGTTYRGWVVIHAGAHRPSTTHIDQCVRLGAPTPTEVELVTRAIIGVAELYRVDTLSKSGWAERHHYHFAFRGAIRLPKPIPAAGKYNFWDLSDDQTAGIVAQVGKLPSPITDRFF